MGAARETMGWFRFLRTFCLCLILVLKICMASTQNTGQIYPGFQGSQMEWKDNKGMFLLSNSSTFALGFLNTLEGLFVLVVIHVASSKAVWTANRSFLIQNSDKFVFEKNGNAYLKGGDKIIWSTDTAGQGVTAMELQDTGNLVVLGENGRILWQSFSHPTDTLLSGQEFVEGMKLKGFPNRDNLFNYLEMKSGDLILYAGFQTPQTYWSMSNESRKTIYKGHGKVHSASMMSNSWNFYDQSQALVWQFNFSENLDPNVTWAGVLDSEGSISFYDLQKGNLAPAESTKIPQNSCSVPEPCEPYYVCSVDNRCQCPSALNSSVNCKPQITSVCNVSKNSVELLHVGDSLNYFALGFVAPSLKSDLNGCREACFGNCSCLVLFFENSSGNCFLFDQIGSFQRSNWYSSGFISYVKVSNNGDLDGGLNRSREERKGGKIILVIVLIAVATVLVIFGVVYLGFRYRRKKEIQECSPDNLEEDDFLDSISGMPIRFRYKELQNATSNFSEKLGQGGFGSVYKGVLPDGTQLAVKKLEGIGQGKKEFRAEVCTIGNIHHVHLVKLKGFCTEGAHRLLVYEFLGKGSLDKLIFKNNRKDLLLDWETRFSIALGTAKGLAYLHEECDPKIIHCDIKPENVLLDDNYLAKVSDFGLAKLMNRDQSHVFTTVRGTRGYLAPEWIANHAISEKSDVFSFGMVLLEIIGGRKNYDPKETAQKAHFPSYAFEKMKEGNLREILDPELKIDGNYEKVSNAIKVALLCIQEEMDRRPPMTKVVQMLEGVCDVPQPPTTSQRIFHIYSTLLKSSSEEGTSSEQNLLEPIDWNSLAPSNVDLSGPR